MKCDIEGGEEGERRGRRTEAPPPVDNSWLHP